MSLTTLLDELEMRMKDAELPYHIGHVNEANKSRADVDSCINRCVAEDTLYAAQLCVFSNAIPQLILALKDAIEMAKFYGDESKWVQRQHTTNFQETTAIFHVDDPSKLPTEFESKSWDATARIKIDHGTKARAWLEKWVKE